jgi:hypothetical protein
MAKDIRERSALLLLRAWTDGTSAGLRIRAVRVPDLARPRQIVSMATGPEEVCELVKAWIDELSAHPAIE